MVVFRTDTLGSPPAPQGRGPFPAQNWWSGLGLADFRVALQQLKNADYARDEVTFTHDVTENGVKIGDAGSVTILGEDASPWRAHFPSIIGFAFLSLGDWGDRASYRELTKTQPAELRRKVAG